MNLRHALRLTSPGACVPFDLQLSTLNFSSCNSFTFFSFRTLCQIPGIGYPPHPLFLDSFLIRSSQSPTVALRSASAPAEEYKLAFLQVFYLPLIRTHPPASLLFATLTKTTGVYVNSSQKGTTMDPKPRDRARCVDTSLRVRYALPFTPRLFSGLRRTDRPLHG